MCRKVFQWLIPLYIVFWFVHAIFFARYFFQAVSSQTFSLSMGFVVLISSHLLLMLLGLTFWGGMLVDSIQRDFKETTTKIIWIVVVVILGILGAIIYYYVEGKNRLIKKK